jgi:uncharacterized integral membrane protein
MRSVDRWDILQAMILLLIIFVVVAVPVLGVGLGLGYALWAVIPGLDLGFAIVAGAVFAVGICSMTGRFLNATREVGRASDEQEDIPEDEEPWVAIAPHLFSSRTPRRGGKKRR